MRRKTKQKKKEDKSPSCRIHDDRSRDELVSAAVSPSEPLRVASLALGEVLTFVHAAALARFVDVQQLFVSVIAAIPFLFSPTRQNDGVRGRQNANSLGNLAEPWIISRGIGHICKC